VITPTPADDAWRELADVLLTLTAAKKHRRRRLIVVELVPRFGTPTAAKKALI